VREFNQQPLALGVAALVVLNLGLGVTVTTTRIDVAAAVVVVPVVAIALGALIASSRAVLVYAAIAINLLSPLPLTGPLPLNAPVEIYLPDVLVLLALGSWVAAWLVNPKATRPSSLRTRVLGWPLLLFGIALFIALARSHERYGTSLVSPPLRMLVYSGIAFAMTDLEPRKAYRWLVILFYGGTVWQVLVALFGVATGTSATDQVLLSTGGERVLAGSTAMFMAGALLLALLNLELDQRAGRIGLHLLMAGLASFALVFTYQRTTFALVPLLVPLSLLAFRRIRSRAVAFLPLCAPFIVLGVLLVPRVDPYFFPTLADRITASPTTDATANWRREAYAAVWSQAREAPLVGIGFGRPASFVLNDVRYTVGQDPHNQFLYLWAGGGLLLLLSFALLLMVFLVDARRRFRSGTTEDRPLVFWAVSLWFVFVVNSLTGIVLTQPYLLLPFWILMLFPMTVRPGGSGSGRASQG
jgi:O-Antigen ligase